MKKTYITSAIIAAILAASMTGCGESNISENTSTVSSKVSSVSENNTDSEQSKAAFETTTGSAQTEAYEENDNAEIQQLSNDTENDAFTARDLEQTADISNSQIITVSDNTTIDITIVPPIKPCRNQAA